MAGFATFAESWIAYLFTAAFGVVGKQDLEARFFATLIFLGLDVVLLLCAAMMINYRKEQLRYRAIDQKWGVGNI